jgi:hypothetical protein
MHIRRHLMAPRIDGRGDDAFRFVETRRLVHAAQGARFPLFSDASRGESTLWSVRIE